MPTRIVNIVTLRYSEVGQCCGIFDEITIPRNRVFEPVHTEVLIQNILDRGTDIDDLWLNMLGALIGYLIYILLSKAPSIQNIFYKFRVKQ